MAILAAPDRMGGAVDNTGSVSRQRLMLAEYQKRIKELVGEEEILTGEITNLNEELLKDIKAASRKGVWNTSHCNESFVLLKHFKDKKVIEKKRS
ncbi:MAG: hypothetical protein HQK82_10720 [Desulfovibrionaceae bacterium]|nr:hypothetical protein [Desulfovibrionaceae bacterium]